MGLTKQRDSESVRSARAPNPYKTLSSGKQVGGLGTWYFKDAADLRARWSKSTDGIGLKIHTPIDIGDMQVMENADFTELLVRDLWRPGPGHMATIQSKSYTWTHDYYTKWTLSTEWILSLDTWLLYRVNLILGHVTIIQSEYHLQARDHYIVSRTEWSIPFALYSIHPIIGHVIIIQSESSLYTRLLYRVNLIVGYMTIIQSESHFPHVTIILSEYYLWTRYYYTVSRSEWSIPLVIYRVNLTLRHMTIIQREPHLLIQDYYTEWILSLDTWLLYRGSRSEWSIPFVLYN
jgi:hypothetical protein